MSYILKLAGWYPNRVDPFTGDFVQRHARSIALYEKVIVLFLLKDPSLPAFTVEVQRSGEGNLIEYIVYYSARGPLQKGMSLLRYIRLGSRLVRRIIQENGIPALVHVSVVWKAGLLALWLKRKYGWDYLLTEHWTGYRKGIPGGLDTKNFLIRKIYQKVLAQARLFLPVSRDLAREVDRWSPGIPFEVVSNVVDTRLFYYEPAKEASPIKKIVHVSTMNHQKNIEGILRVLEKLSLKREDIEITLVGPVSPEIRQIVIDRGLDKIFLAGELTYPEVAAVLRQSNFLFLFSRYENLPCVVLEAFCCGLPVVVTSVGGLPEIVDISNGILVESEKEDQLLQAFYRVLDSYGIYDRVKIAATASEKFSYSAVGGQLHGIYRKHRPLAL